MAADALCGSCDRLLLNLLASLAEFELEITHERVTTACSKWNEKPLGVVPLDKDARRSPLTFLYSVPASKNPLRRKVAGLPQQVVDAQGRQPPALVRV